MNVKILPEDTIFSQYIRKRDGRCMRCKSPVRFNEKGLPVSHTNSHYITRGNWATRMDEWNCITLCFPCHRIWGGDGREEYKKFMQDWLGMAAFQNLIMRSNEYANKLKVRKWAKEEYKNKLRELKI